MGALTHQKRINAHIFFEVDDGIRVIGKVLEVHEVEAADEMSRTVAIYCPNILYCWTNACNLNDALQILLFESTYHCYAFLGKEIEQLATRSMFYKHDIWIELHDTLFQLLIDCLLIAN